MRVRECTQCGETHPIEYFHKKTMVKSTGLASQCKFCRSKNAMKKRLNVVKQENKYLKIENDYLSGIVEEYSDIRQKEANKRFLRGE